MQKRIQAVYLISIFGMLLVSCHGVMAQVPEVGVSFEVNEVRYTEHFFDHELVYIKTKACDHLIASFNDRFPFLMFVKRDPNNPLLLSVVVDSEAGLNRKTGEKPEPKASNVLFYFTLAGNKVRDNNTTAAWTFKTIQQYHDPIPSEPNDFLDELIKFIGQPESIVDTEKDEVKQLQGRYASLLEKLFKKVLLAEEAEHVKNTPYFIIKEYLRERWPVSAYSEFSVDVHLEDPYNVADEILRPFKIRPLPQETVFGPMIPAHLKNKLVTEAFAPLRGADKKDIELIVVSNELGMGVHAETEAGRKFTDLQGCMNQYIAKSADKVVLMVAGIPVTIKERNGQ